MKKIIAWLQDNGYDFRIEESGRDLSVFCGQYLFLRQVTPRKTQWKFFRNHRAINDFDRADDLLEFIKVVLKLDSYEKVD